MKIRFLATVAAGVLLVTGPTNAADPDKLEGITCPVSGKAVKAASTVDYKGGQVYFCCNGCPKRFNNETADFASKANAQLVATGQAEQWRKWSFPLAAGPSEVTSGSTAQSAWIAVNKQRLLRRYRLDESSRLVAVPTVELPTLGCDLELTGIQIGAAEWWTVGLEAFGPESALPAALKFAAAELL